MGYFVTGATGFIGRHLVAELVRRGEPVWVLVRPGSAERLERLVRDCGPAAQLIRPVDGDLGAALLGLPAERRDALRGQVRHFFHLGALYDLAADDDELERINVGGTRHALQLAADLGAGCFHHVSSIAVAGRYRGTFTEEMFGESTGLDLPYFRTKHEAEGLVRASRGLPWRIYRPGMVVGHSRTGVIDKVDGPYYVFRVIQKLRDTLPRWVPLVGFHGGHINLVPVDFVAAALAHLAHVPAQDGQCFHLTDPRDRRVGDVLNVFARAAHAPTLSLRLAPGSLGSLAHLGLPADDLLPSAGRVLDQLCDDFGMPRSLPGLLNHPTRFDAARAQALLEPAGIRVPSLDGYAWRLWDYWERCLDPGLHTGGRLATMVGGRNVLVTGGSSGIGRALALRLVDAGARVLVVARDERRLAELRADAGARGGQVSTYGCDIADAGACDAFIRQLLQDHGHVDILVNNAGRSIRRGIDQTYDRLHDYERLMRLNYHAAVRITLGLLPAMVDRGTGHVVNISSIGVLTNAPRFAAYNASKAALEAFSRCASAEYAARGVRFTIVNLPLVRTPMIAPTKVYEFLDLMEPEQAAEQVCAAIIDQPERVATPLGTIARLVEMFTPRLGRAIMSESYRMFPDSTPDATAADVDAQLRRRLGAFGAMARGLHW